MAGFRMRFFNHGLIGALSLGLGGCYNGLDADGDGGTDGTDSVGSAGDPSGDDESSGDSSGGDDPPAVECGGMVLDPGPNLARRLTRFEYTNTVRALLGVEVGDEAQELLPAELRADGFSNTSSGLITTLAHVEAYDALAGLAVQRVGDLSQFVGQYTSCQEYEPACEIEFVENLGLRAFRRPLSEDERDILVSVFPTAQEEGEPFEVGAGLVIEAMMQSPPFLYRLEDERAGQGARELGGYEMASRLSYLIWAGPPDDLLLDAAGTDALRSDAQIEAQVDRMLATPAAREASAAFVDDWLHLSRLDGLPRDPERFPDWTTAIADAMVEETQNFFGSVAWDQQRPMVELFTAQETVLTPELATYYGLQPQGEGPQPYDVSTITERGGLLTQGSLLTIGGDESSMVARGLFIFETLLCQHPTSPPPGVDTTPPPLEPGRSQRYYSEERTENDSCAGCHLQFEPLAWGLGRYLADGTYALQDAYGNDLQEDGFLRLPGSADELPYQGPAEMMELIATSDATRECLGSKAAQFAIGRALTGDDDCSMEAVQSRYAASDGTWRDLVVAIALSPGFRSVRVED